jgi:hypothetical protein
LGHSPSSRDRVHVLLNSSYDSEGVSPTILRDFGIDPDSCPGPGDCPTILERALRLLPRAPAPERQDKAPDEQPNPQETHAEPDQIGPA